MTPPSHGELEEQLVSELLSAAKVEETVMRLWPNYSPTQIAQMVSRDCAYRIDARWVWAIHQRAIVNKAKPLGS